MAKEHLYEIVTENPNDMLLDILKGNVKPSFGKGKELKLLTQHKYDLSPIITHVNKVVKSRKRIDGPHNKSEDAKLSHILHKTLKAIPVSNLYLRHGFWFWFAAVKFPEYTRKRWFYDCDDKDKLIAKLEKGNARLLRYVNPGTNRGFAHQCFGRLYLASEILHDPSLNSKQQLKVVENVFTPQDVWTQAIERNMGLLPQVVRALATISGKSTSKDASKFMQETGKKLNNLAGTLALDQLSEAEIMSLL